MVIVSYGVVIMGSVSSATVDEIMRRADGEIVAFIFPRVHSRSIGWSWFVLSAYHLLCTEQSFIPTPTCLVRTSDGMVAVVFYCVHSHLAPTFESDGRVIIFF